MVEEEIVNENFKVGLVVATELPMYGRNAEPVLRSGSNKRKSVKSTPTKRVISSGVSGKKNKSHKSSISQSSESQSRNLIMGLTQGKVNVDDNTILLIN